MQRLIIFASNKTHHASHLNSAPGWVFDFIAIKFMKYSKAPLSISDQITRLKERGLIFHDEQKAANYLSNISYYRLRAYTYPFQDNSDPNHPFIKGVSFEDIINLYIFDRRLRILVFNAIEKIEIALRTKIINIFSLKNGSHWHENLALYRKRYFFDKILMHYMKK